MEKKKIGATLRIGPGGRVIRLQPETLTGHLPDGVLRRVTTEDGVVRIPDTGTGRYSVPNAVRRSMN